MSDQTDGFNPPSWFMFNLVSSKSEGKEQERRVKSNSMINVINFHTSNLLFPLLHVWRLRNYVFSVWILPSSSAAERGRERGREKFPMYVGVIPPRLLSLE